MKNWKNWAHNALNSSFFDDFVWVPSWPPVGTGQGWDEVMRFDHTFEWPLCELKSDLKRWEFESCAKMTRSMGRAFKCFRNKALRSPIFFVQPFLMAALLGRIYFKDSSRIGGIISIVWNSNYFNAWIFELFAIRMFF